MSPPASPSGTTRIFPAGAIRRATSASLTLVDVLNAEEGSYTVQVSNPAGTVVSSEAVLTAGVKETISSSPTSVKPSATS